MEGLLHLPWLSDWKQAHDWGLQQTYSAYLEVQMEIAVDLCLDQLALQQRALQTASWDQELA